MADAHSPDSLADIRAILAQVATAQQVNTTAIAELRQVNATAISELRRENATAIAELRQENARANAELRQSIADLRQENAADTAELRQCIADRREENAAANAELRRENATAISEIRQENVTANAELRREIKTNIDDVSAMIFEGSQETKQITDSNARAIQAWEQRLEAERDETINVEVDTLNTIDGLRTDVQTLTHFVRDGFSTLSQAIVSLSQELSAQIQNLIDITRDNTGRITRLENEDHH